MWSTLSAVPPLPLAVTSPAHERGLSLDHRKGNRAGELAVRPSLAPRHQDLGPEGAGLSQAPASPRAKRAAPPRSVRTGPRRAAPQPRPAPGGGGGLLTLCSPARLEILRKGICLSNLRLTASAASAVVTVALIFVAHSGC